MHLEIALNTWKEQRSHYQNQIKKVIAKLSKPLTFMPSPSFDQRLQELKDSLTHNFQFQEEDTYYEVYLYFIQGRKNITLMELAIELSTKLGGQVKFWQNKIVDLANYVFYHPQFSIWESFKGYEKYLPLPPEQISMIKRLRSLGKAYISALVQLIKIIEKCRPQATELAKIDQSFKKVKKIEEKYYAFLEEMKMSVNIDECSNVSFRGKTKAKSSLFFFLKRKQQKNTLNNYNFIITKENNALASKMLKGNDLQTLQKTLINLKKQNSNFQEATETRSMFNYRSDFSNHYSNRASNQNEEENHANSRVQQDVCKLREQFKNQNAKNKELIQNQVSKLDSKDKITYCTIWDKDYFFTYKEYPISNEHPIDFTDPFGMHQFVNYEIDSEVQYDELLADDVQQESSQTDLDSQSNQSFVVSDGYQSNGEDQKQVKYTKGGLGDRWNKSLEGLEQYSMKCVGLPINSLPLSLEEEQIDIDPRILNEIIENRGRMQIFQILQEKKIKISRQKLDSYLRSNFKRIKSKQKRIIYVPNNSFQQIKIQINGQFCECIDLTQDEDTNIEESVQVLQIEEKSKSRSKKVSTGRTRRSKRLEQKSIQADAQN